MCLRSSRSMFMSESALIYRWEIFGSSVTMSNAKAPNFLTLTLLPARSVLSKYVIRALQMICIYIEYNQLTRSIL